MYILLIFFCFLDLHQAGCNGGKKTAKCQSKREGVQTLKNLGGGGSINRPLPTGHVRLAGHQSLGVLIRALLQVKYPTGGGVSQQPPPSPSAYTPISQFSPEKPAGQTHLPTLHVPPFWHSTPSQGPEGKRHCTILSETPQNM